MRLLLTVLSLLVFCVLLFERASAAPPLYQQSPFDEVKLDENNNSIVLKIKPLDLPERKLPAPANRKGDLEVELIERPGEKFAIAWTSIVDVKFYEERVLAEGLRTLIRQWLERGEFERLKCIELLFVTGLSNKDAARALSLSEQAVANHKHFVLGKLKEWCDRSFPGLNIAPLIGTT